MTRTAIGHGRHQAHAFLCPSCGTCIEYTIAINHEKVTFEYGDEPVNATWSDDEDGAIAAIAFDVEPLLPGRGPVLTDPTSMTVSPFIQMTGIMRDALAYRQEYGRQLHVLKHRHEIDRLFTHVEKANWTLLRDELVRLGMPDDGLEPDKLRLHVQIVLGETQKVLIRNSGVASKAFASLIKRATTNALSATETFLKEYRTSGRLSQLWTQMRAARRDFLANADAMMPLLQVKHWRTAPTSLADCRLLNKQFVPLRTLYIDCFETLARVSVVALGLAGLADRGTPSVPTNSGSMSIWDFEKLANANKAPHLLRAPDCAFLAPHLDTNLRNGVGHNSARYAADKDDVVIAKQVGDVIQESRLTYTEFVDKVLDIASTLMDLHVVAFWILDANKGALT
ncbi:MAG: hypothetical protein U1E73_01855 [Planctomycetota bacterium]